MTNKQITLLQQLAQKINSETRSKKAISHSFQEAKILTAKGKFTKQYASLEKLAATK